MILNKEDALGQIMTDVSELLEDLYQSGFDTVHESTLEGLKELALRTSMYGMEMMSAMLAQMTEGLSARCHQLKKNEDNVSSVYAQLNMYVRICREKIEYDRCVSYYVDKV